MTFHIPAVAKELASLANVAKVFAGGVIHKLGAWWYKARQEAKALAAKAEADAKAVVKKL